MKRALACLCLGLVPWMVVAGEAEKSQVRVVLFTTEPANLFRWDRWAEAVVRVKNETDREETARLVVQFPTVSDNLQTSFTRQVRLPPKSQQEVKLMVRFPPAQSMSREQTKGFPVRVRLMRDTVVLAEDTFYSVPVTEERYCVLWCDRPETSLGFRVKKSRDPAAPSGDGAAAAAPAAPSRGPRDSANAPPWVRSRTDFSVNTATSQRMPHHVGGYDPYDIVVLSGWEDGGLDALQTETLLNWVRRGGQLVCIAGPHWTKHANPDLAAALPVWPSERYTVSAIPEIETPLGSLDIADGIPVMDGPRARGEILIGTADQPFFTRRTCGLGNVYFLALDVNRQAESLSPGMKALFHCVLGLAGEAISCTPLHEAHDARQILEKLIAVKIVTRTTMAFWLGGYMLAAVAGLVVARRARNPMTGYGVVAAAAVAAFIFLQIQSVLQRSRSIGGIEQVCLYRADVRPGSADVRVTGLLGFFPSAPRNLDFVLQPFDATVGAASGFGGDRPEVAEFQTRDRMGVGSWQLTPNSLRAATLDVFTRLPKAALQYKARLTRDGPVIEAQSSLPWKLSQPFFKWRRFVTPLPDLEPGKAVTIETWKEKSNWGRYQSSNLQGGSSLARGLLRQAVFPDPRRTLGGAGDIQRTLQAIHGANATPITLGGFTDQSIELTPAGPGQSSLGLWNAPGDEAMLSSDAEFYAPPGLLEMKFSQREAVISYMGGGNFSGGREETLRVKYQLPECLRGATADEILVHGGFDSLQFTPSVEIAFGTQAAEPAQWTTIPWGATMKVPDPSVAFAEGRDTIWLRVNIARKEQDAAATAAATEGVASLSQHWSVENLDVSVRGKLKP